MSARPTKKPNIAQQNPQRRAALAKVHIAVKQLRMADDDYRQLLLDETGKMSAGDCSMAELDKVLARMKALGFSSKASKQRGAAHPMARKARALWISLYYLNAVHNPSEKALEAFAKRQLKTERLQWADQSQGYKLIEALIAMGLRHGWNGKGSNISLLQRKLCDAIIAKLAQAAAIPANWTFDETALRLTGIDLQAVQPMPTAEDYTTLAKALGKKLREIPQ